MKNIALSVSLSMSYSQNIAGNYSNVSWAFKFSKSSATYNHNGVNFYVNIGGARQVTSTFVFRKGTTSGTIRSGTTTIAHNSDGTYGRCNGYAYVGPTGFSTPNASASNYVTLPTIPRASTVSCPSTFNAGETGAITISRKNSSFTHTATNSLGDGGMSATSDIGTSLSYTPSLALFDSVEYSNTNTRAGTITIQTKSGTTNIGSPIISNFNVILPETQETKPICSLGTNNFVEIGSSYYAKYGVLIAGKSKIAVSGCTSSGKHNATIASHSANVSGAQASYSNGTITVSNLTATTSNAILSYSVKDSRGFTSTASTKPIPYKVVDYKVPSITSISAVRCDANGSVNPSAGTYVKFLINYNADPIAVDPKYTPNKPVIKIYKINYNSTGAPISRTLLNITNIPNGEYTNPIGTYPISENYQFEATITDDITTTESALGKGSLCKINTAKALLSFHGADGVTIGRIASSSGFNVTMPTTLEDNVTCSKSLKIGNIDMTITDGEYNELLQLLGGE